MWCGAWCWIAMCGGRTRFTRQRPQVRNLSRPPAQTPSGDPGATSVASRLPANHGQWSLEHFQLSCFGSLRTSMSPWGRTCQCRVRWDSNPLPSWVGGRGARSEGSATCSSSLPAVTARARRRPPPFDVARTQHGPAPAPGLATFLSIADALCRSGPPSGTGAAGRAGQDRSRLG